MNDDSVLNYENLVNCLTIKKKSNSTTKTKTKHINISDWITTDLTK